MPPRTFTASTTADIDRPPIPFDLHGVRRTKGPAGETVEWSESFEASATPDVSVANSLRNAFITDERGRRGVNPGAAIEFIERCLVQDSRERFVQLINDDDRFVRIELLGDVMEWLSEEVVQRPTHPSSLSSDGTTATAHGSVATLPALDSDDQPVAPPPG